ncbi:MAG: hypothetical protein JXA99_01495 [Candidatus Lokiarchaeota archaeon]|nr:hypothetical protein [Candidatus Lokiarchaeota archaeon]
MESLKKQEGFAKVKCGHCGLEKEVLINSISEPVDAFGDFIDVFYADTELQRLEKGIAKLKENNEWGELALSYSLLSSLCRIKAAQLLEEEDNADINEVNDWKAKAEKYKRLEKDVLLKLETEELEEGIKTDEDSLFSEHDESDIRKKRDIEDVFEDPGFLEF